MNKPKFEDCIDVINREIEKRRHTWKLDAITWMDFDDVAQKIRIHINDKWYQYNPKKKLEPWVNTVITNQIRNEIRNVYTSFSKPCVSCVMDEGDDLCRYTPSKKKCSECPLYAKWEKSKKNAYNVKVPLALEFHVNDVQPVDESDIDVDRALDVLQQKLKTVLTKSEYEVFVMLYIKNASDEEVAKKMGFKTNEENRKAGYRQIINYKKTIIKASRKIFSEEEIRFLWTV